MVLPPPLSSRRTSSSPRGYRPKLLAGIAPLKASEYARSYFTARCYLYVRLTRKGHASAARSCPRQEQRCWVASAGRLQRLRSPLRGPIGAISAAPLIMLRSNQGRLRLPPKAARTRGLPRSRTAGWINRAKRTTRCGRSTPLRGQEPHGRWTGWTWRRWPPSWANALAPSACSPIVGCAGWPSDSVPMSPSGEGRNAMDAHRTIASNT
jgi:hypothetical protein